MVVTNNDCDNNDDDDLQLNKICKEYENQILLLISPPIFPRKKNYPLKNILWDRDPRGRRSPDVSSKSFCFNSVNILQTKSFKYRQSPEVAFSTFPTNLRSIKLPVHWRVNLLISKALLPRSIQKNWELFLLGDINVDLLPEVEAPSARKLKEVFDVYGLHQLHQQSRRRLLIFLKPLSISALRTRHGASWSLVWCNCQLVITRLFIWHERLDMIAVAHE